MASWLRSDSDGASKFGYGLMVSSGCFALVKCGELFSLWM